MKGGFAYGKDHSANEKHEREEISGEIRIINIRALTVRTHGCRLGRPIRDRGQPCGGRRENKAQCTNDGKVEDSIEWDYNEGEDEEVNKLAPVSQYDMEVTGRALYIASFSHGSSRNTSQMITTMPVHLRRVHDENKLFEGVW